jgi:16S rRNA (adenine1518-N6/adenine1519-N6)-dimethyltransferase
MTASPPPSTGSSWANGDHPVQTLTQIKELLESRGLNPKRSLGQNFLIDHNLIRKLVDQAGVGPGDLVLEVGPGTGTLTEELLSRGCDVVACELDDSLASMLAERWQAGEIPAAAGAQLEVVHADCLESKTKLAPALSGALRARLRPGRALTLVANLPYGAATPLMMTLMVDWPECRALAVTIQREVVDRLAAPERSPDRGALSVVAQALCEVQRVATLPRECFWPRPDVTSAMALLTRRAEPLTRDPHRLSAACRILFGQRRKQLGSVVGKRLGPAGWPAGVVPTMRAEELAVFQAEALAERIHLEGS